MTVGYGPLLRRDGPSPATRSNTLIQNAAQMGLLIENDNDPAKPQQAAQDAPKARFCPICRKPRSERYDPFCSKRCAASSGCLS